MKHIFPYIICRIVLAGAVLTTQALFAHRAEANFWTQRAEAVQRMKGESSPASLGTGGFSDMLSAPPSVGFLTKKADHLLPAFADQSFPAPLREESADILAALPIHATIRSFTDAGPGTPLLIHLQDVHGHREAQRNIASLLTELIRLRPKTPILLEGGAGPISRPTFGTVSAETAQRTAAFFFNIRMISGAEVAALTAPVETPFFGAENPDLYLANVDAVRAASPHRHRLLSRLAAWRTHTEADADRLFNSSLRVLHNESRGWFSGSGSVSEQARFLWQHRDTQKCPELEKFMGAVQMEKKILLPAVQRDRNALLSAMEGRLSGPATRTLTQTALAFRSGALRPSDFYRRLRETVQKCGLSLDRYPAFEYYTRYVILVDSILPDSLHREMESLESSLWHRWAETTEERRRVALIRDLRLAAQLAALELTPDQWTAYVHRSEEIHHLPHRLAEEGSLSLNVWTDTLDPFERFYRFAEARNGALADSVARLIPTDSGTRPLAVLVAGGFHSAGLASVFSAQKISVLTLSPKLEGVESATPFDLFTRDRTPLEQLFATPRISLSDTLTLQPIGMEAAPRWEALMSLAPRLALLLDPSKQGEEGQNLTMDDEQTPGLIVSKDGRDIPDGKLKELTGNGTVLEKGVSTSLDAEEDQAPCVYVFAKKRSATARWYRSLKKGLTKVFGVALLAFVLLPFTPSPSAQATTFFNTGTSVQVTVEKGEHLWGVAQRVLEAKGVRATNKATLELVKDLVQANRGTIKNPHLIYPGVAYTLPAQHLTPAVTQSLTGVTSVETPATGTPSPTPRSPSFSPDLPSGDESSGLSPRSTTNPALDSSSATAPEAPGEKGYDMTLLFIVASAYVYRATRSMASPDLLSALQSGTKKLLEKTIQLKKVVSRHVAIPKNPHRLFYSLAIAGMVAAIFWLVPLDVLTPNVFDPMHSFLSPATVMAAGSHLTNQWPVELGLAIALGLASYFIWWRAKEVDLSAVEKSDPRLMDWISKLDTMETVVEGERLESDSLLPLLNNIQALTLNHQVTPASLADRGMVEKQIEIYRSISRLSRDTVRLLDARLNGSLSEDDSSRERIVDVREKIFLYQLYALKVSHSLVNASVAHWAFSNFDNHSSWFERWRLGYILRSVRGVRTMIQRSTSAFNRNMFRDVPGPGDRIWDRAADLSAVRLGNTLIPGLYSHQKIQDLSHTFDGLMEKAKSKNLSDMTVKDLHRKGVSTMMGLLFWSVTISMTLSFGHALLAFLTGLGANMALFRLQAAGTRRDSFYREGLANWIRTNVENTHPNGRLHSNGNTLGEDPFHLDRHSIPFNFKKAQTALEIELGAKTPSADLVILVARTPEERKLYEARKQDPRIFRPDVPVVVLFVPENQGTLLAYGTAALYPYSDEFTALLDRYPHLKDRHPSELRIGTLVSKESGAEAVAMTLNDLPSLRKHLHPGDLAGTTVFDLGLMNIYRATQESAQKGLGGMAFRWADRAYIGPIRIGEGHGITLDAYWANREEMVGHGFGAVVATPGKPIKLIRMRGDDNTFRVLGDKHPGRVYDSGNEKLDQYQGFSGEGFYSFDAEGAAAQIDYLQKLVRNYKKLREKPPLDLLMNFLIPAQIARRHMENPQTISQKVATYFAQNGFLTDSSRKNELNGFNLKNARKTTLFTKGQWSFMLNANPVDGFFYGGATYSSSEEEKSLVNPSRPKKKHIYPRFREALGILLVPLAALGTALSHWTPKGFLAAVSIPLLTVWLLMSPVGLIASRVALAGGAVVHSLGRIRRADRPIDSPHGAQDITLETWSHPARSVDEMTAAVNELEGISSPLEERAQRALARLVFTLIASMPLQNNLLEGFDAKKTRQLLQSAAPDVWAKEADATDQQGAAGIVDRTALRSLAYQVLEVRREASRGNALDETVGQTAFLAGLAGITGTALSELHDLMTLWGGRKNGQEGWEERWNADVKRGRSARVALDSTLTPTHSFGQAPETTFTALRVTELMPSARSSSAQRQALIASLHRQASSAQMKNDILVINGRAAQGLDEDAARKILQERLNDPALNAYLASVRLVLIPGEQFTPENVLDRLPKELAHHSMDLITVNSNAIVVNPLQGDPPYRVLLLELLGGEIQYVDVIGVARKALNAARVVAIGA
jgi:hypothetical protein